MSRSFHSSSNLFIQKESYAIPATQCCFPRRLWKIVKFVSGCFEPIVGRTWLKVSSFKVGVTIGKVRLDLSIGQRDYRSVIIFANEGLTSCLTISDRMARLWFSLSAPSISRVQL